MLQLESGMGVVYANAADESKLDFSSSQASIDLDSLTETDESLMQNDDNLSASLTESDHHSMDAEPIESNVSAGEKSKDVLNRQLTIATLQHTDSIMHQAKPVGFFRRKNVQKPDKKLSYVISSREDKCEAISFNPVEISDHVFQRVVRNFLKDESYYAVKDARHLMFGNTHLPKRLWCFADREVKYRTEVLGSDVRIMVTKQGNVFEYKSNVRDSGYEYSSLVNNDTRNRIASIITPAVSCHHSENNQFISTLCTAGPKKGGYMTIKYNKYDWGAILFKRNTRYYYVVQGGSKKAFTLARRNGDSLIWASYLPSTKKINVVFHRHLEYKYQVWDVKVNEKTMFGELTSAVMLIVKSRKEMKPFDGYLRKYANTFGVLHLSLDPTYGYDRVINGDYHNSAFGLADYDTSSVMFDSDLSHHVRPSSKGVYSKSDDVPRYHLCLYCFAKVKSQWKQTIPFGNLVFEKKKFPSLYWADNVKLRRIESQYVKDYFTQRTDMIIPARVLSTAERRLSVIDSPTISDFSYSASPNVDTLSYREALSYNVSHSSILQLEPSVIFLMMTLILVLPIWPIKLFRSYKYKETNVQ